MTSNKLFPFTVYDDGCIVYEVHLTKFWSGWVWSQNKTVYEWNDEDGNGTI